MLQARLPFLSPDQQYQSTDDTIEYVQHLTSVMLYVCLGSLNSSEGMKVIVDV